jgi:hypothetical protein
MILDSKRNWLRRSIISAVVSGLCLSLHPLDRLQPFYWAPGLAFSLLVVTGRSRRLELLAAVVLSYTLGYASSDMLESLGTWPMRVGVVALGSGLLAMSLRWKGGLSAMQARDLFLLGTVLALPFWWVLDRSGGGVPSFPIWIAGFSVWQMPVAWYYLKES